MNFSDDQIKLMLVKIEYEIARQQMSKREFYEKSGVSSSLYSQWNTGSVKPSMKSIGRVADALGMSVEFLLGVEKEEEKEKSPSEEDELMEDLQMLRDSPERRSLLKSSKGLTPEQVKQISDIMQQMRRGNADDY